MRLATSDDVKNITPEQKLALSLIRIVTRKARRAYYAAHHG